MESNAKKEDVFCGAGTF